MSWQITRPICSVLVSILLISDLAVGAIARTDDCVIEPTHVAPKNSEWRYRTDRAKHRKCWFLRAARAAPASLQSPPMANSTAIRAGDNLSEKERKKVFREFEASMAHQAGEGLSEKEQEKLFTEFLEWRRRNDN